jgi:hypothetical protein
MLRAFFLIFICVLCVHARAQLPKVSGNAVELLRALQVQRVYEDTSLYATLTHDALATRVTVEHVYFEYVYDQVDSMDYEEVVDSIWITSTHSEVHYFNGDAHIDSSFYFQQIKDSSKVDTSRIMRYTYRKDKSLETVREVDFGHPQPIEKVHAYFGEGNHIDSVFEYANVVSGTFGPVHLDTLVLERKQVFKYDIQGRKSQKLRWIHVMEDYTYPKANLMVTREAPHHPRSGCIVDNTISYAKEETVQYNAKGLVEHVTTYYLSKKEGGAWERAEPYSYSLSYEYYSH